MDQTFFRVPWAFAGDRVSPPVAQQPDGSVSYTQGFGPLYEADPEVNPNAKPVPRDETNGLYFDLTLALGALQAEGAPEFITAADNGGEPFPYARGARVRFRAAAGDPLRTYISRVDNNTALPTDTASWAAEVFEEASDAEATAGQRRDVWMSPAATKAAIAAAVVSVPAASTTVAGIQRNATNAEAQAGTATALTVTPAGLESWRGAKMATDAQAVTGTSRDLLMSPAATKAAIVAAAVTVPDATTAVAGIQRNATNAEAQAGTSTARTVTPAGLESWRGAKMATDAQAVTGTSRDLLMSPAATKAAIVAAAVTVPDATTAVAGIQRNATNAEAQAGTSTARTVTPAALKSWGDAKAVLLTGNQTVAGSKIFNNPMQCPAYAGNGAFRIRPNGLHDTVGEVQVNSSGAINAPGGYDTPSSRTIKTDLGPFPYGLGQVLALQPALFAYKPEAGVGDRARLGFYAEDVRGVVGEAVSDAGPEESVSPLLLHADQLVPVLWRAVQQLEARVAELEAGRRAC